MYTHFNVRGVKRWTYVQKVSKMSSQGFKPILGVFTKGKREPPWRKPKRYRRVLMSSYGNLHP